MSISSEVTRLSNAKTAIASAIANKGVTVPSGTKLDGMATLIGQIEGGGGGDPGPPQDGKTRLYIDAPDKYRMDVPLYFSQTVTNGVLIDKGDGSEPFTLSGTGERNTTLSYTEPGEYCIVLEVLNGIMRLDGGSSSVAIGGSSQGYRNMLYKAEIGGSVTSIGTQAFYSCYSLQSITISDSVTSIGTNAFHSCYALQSITIPDSVTSIGDGAFAYCYALQSITIPDSVTSIGTQAFQYCYSLQSVTIPDSVTSIGTQAFYYCYSLQSITISDSVTSIGNQAFYNCRSLQSLTIPDSVTSIGANAFYYCYSLQSITIPDSVTSIGTSAFSGCTFMKEYIFLPTTPPTLANTNAFTNIPTDCKIYVPDASVTAYKTATNWITQASKIYPMSERVVA